ncbi:MAG: UDP-2,3-diacylglucosamine diphosphatase [Syntrophus sp. (in: bacteria)]
MIPTQEIKPKNQKTPLRCLFLADAHLRDERDAHYQALLQFLSQIKGRDSAQEPSMVVGKCSTSESDIIIDHLFILGDFFDFWFSSQSRIYPGFRPIIDRLIHLKREGVTIHFCEGNHDFLMKPYFCRILGMNVHEDWASLNLEGRKTLISHGDLVDRTNHRYLFLRKILRSRTFFFLQKMLPLSILWALARRSSLASQELMGGAQDVIMARMVAFAEGSFREGYDAVILGHCHKPQLQEFVTGSDTKTFATLGDWIAHYTYLLYDNHGFHLLCYHEGEGRIKLDMERGAC